MPDTAAIENRPAWIDLSSTDAAASREFYAKLFGWEVAVSTDPNYGGYAMATLDGKDIAGISPAQSADGPNAWSLYVGTADADALAVKVTAAGGTVVVPPFEVGDQGRMAVFQDPSGAFISAWQPLAMSGFQSSGANAYWAELNARGVEKALTFYQDVFGWSMRTTPMGEGAPPYTQFALGEDRVAGAMEMDPMVPSEVPSYWLVYFDVVDVDASNRQAMELGAREMLAPMDFPGGRFAILGDPQGAAFGLLRLG